MFRHLVWVWIIVIIFNWETQSTPTSERKNRECELRISEVFGNFRGKILKDFFVELEGVCTVGTPSGFSTAFHKLIFLSPPSSPQGISEIFGVVNLQNEKLNSNGFLVVGSSLGKDTSLGVLPWGNSMVKIKQLIQVKLTGGSFNQLSARSHAPYGILLVKDGIGGKSAQKTELKAIKIEDGQVSLRLQGPLEAVVGRTAIDAVVFGDGSQHSCSIFNRLVPAFVDTPYILPYDFDTNYLGEGNRQRRELHSTVNESSLHTTIQRSLEMAFKQLNRRKRSPEPWPGGKPTKKPTNAQPKLQQFFHRTQSEVATEVPCTDLPLTTGQPLVTGNPIRTSQPLRTGQPTIPPVLQLPRPLRISVSRCTGGTESFNPYLFKYTLPTPGAPNNCERGLPVIRQEINAEIFGPADNINNPDTPASCEISPIARKVEKAVNTYFSYNHSDQPYDFPTLRTPAETSLKDGNFELYDRLHFLKLRTGNLLESNRTEREERLAMEQREAQWRSMMQKLDEKPPHKHVPLNWIKTHKQELLPWLDYIPNANKDRSTFRCNICYTHREAPYLSQQHRPILAEENGMIRTSSDFTRDSLREHVSSSWHTKILSVMEAEKKQQIEKAMQTAYDKEYNLLSDEQKSTANMFRIIYSEAKMTIPFISHPRLVRLMEILGMDMGSNHHSRFAPPTFLKAVSSDFHTRFLEQLRRDNQPFSIILDTATDSPGNNFLVILIQALQRERPVVFFWRLIPVGIDSTADGFLSMIREAVREDGLEAAVTQNLVGITTDGAAVFSGSQNGLGVKLSQTYKQDRGTLYRVHCMAHRLNLAGRSIVDTVNAIDTFENHIKSISRFFNAQHPKNVAYLVQVAKAKEVKALRITYAFDTRWATSEGTVLQHLRVMIPLLDIVLQSISVDETISPETQAQATGLREIVTDRGFVLTTFFMSDVITALGTFSLILQRSGALIIGKEFHVRNLVQTISNFKDQDGAHLTILMENLQCKTDALSPAFRKCRNSRDVEKSHAVRWIQPDAADNVNLNHLRRRRGTDCNSFKNMREEVIAKLLEMLHNYFPEGSMANFDILDPKSVSKEQVVTRSYGLREITALATRFRLPVNDVVKQWQEMWYSLAQRTDFEEKMLQSPLIFWPQTLRDNTVQVGTQVRRLIRIVLALPATSADAERAFSLMGHIKSIKRMSMSVGTLQDLLRISINGVEDVSNFPAHLYASKWQGWHVKSKKKRGGKRKSNAGGVPSDPKRPALVGPEADAIVTEDENQREAYEREIGIVMDQEAQNGRFVAEGDNDDDVEYLGGPAIVA